MGKANDLSRDAQALDELRGHFNFTVGNRFDYFAWTIVSLHRRMALGVNLPDAQLGRWIYQYGKHLERCGLPHRSQRFTFDPKGNYKGRDTTYTELTAWILKPLTASTAHFAYKWDQAIDALLTYELNQTADNWNRFRLAMMTARKPFW